MKPLANMTLEMSLKPFIRKDDDFIERLYEDVFRRWYSLLVDAETISIMYWIGDGSEIFEYNNKLDDTFEWGKWLGFANEGYPTTAEEDPNQEAIVAYPRLYRDDALDFTYGDLQRIIRIMKEVGGRLLNKPMRAGGTIDPGPEFVPSPFKYERHPEILLGAGHGNGGCGHNIDCTAHFHADNTPYAGFPEGIPEGTSFGTFLGRQSELFMTAMDIDFLWFSNSFGFGRCPYGYGAYGEFFDGTDFLPEGNVACRDEVLQFWKDFRVECPDKMIETRGTDFPVGMDLVNHATPFKQLYEGDFKFIPPPNTPWPALTNNYGIALAGYMSRIASFPGEFPYRFYSSDPWWCNTPWVDRFERSPHDMFMSLSVAKIDSDGQIHTPNRVSFLSIDTSWGEVPEQIPDEVIPHAKEALSHVPDQASPFVWIYPFEDYNRMTFEDCDRANEVYGGDILMQEALNCGLPLNTVVTVENFLKTHSDASTYGQRVLVTPVPDAGTELERILLEKLEQGQNLLFYGPTAHASTALQELLGVTQGAELSGDFELVESVPHPDRFQQGEYGDTFRHQPAISSGAMTEVPAHLDDCLLSMCAERGGEQRLVAVARHVGKGILGWVRGSSSADVEKGASRAMNTWSPGTRAKSELFFRQVLQSMGYTIAFDREEADNTSAHLMCVRNLNGFYLTLFSNDLSANARIRFPQGAPLFQGRDVDLVDGCTVLPIWRFQHRSCRIFVDGMDSGRLSLHQVGSKHFRYRTRLILRGLEGATLRFYPPVGREDDCQMLLNCNEHIFTTGEPFEKKRIDDATGTFYEIYNVTGSMTFAWW